MNTPSFQVLTPDFGNSARARIRGLDLVLGHYEHSLKAVFTLSARCTKWCCVKTLGTRYADPQFRARALVPGHRHKMVLCSDTGYPIC